jgi:hypothetical protein
LQKLQILILRLQNSIRGPPYFGTNFNLSIQLLGIAENLKKSRQKKNKHKNMKPIHNHLPMVINYTGDLSVEVQNNDQG